jgi:hypothetical protein
MVPLSNLILYGLGLVLILPKGLAIYWGSLVAKYIIFFNKLVDSWFIHTQAGRMYIEMNAVQVTLYYLLLLFAYLWIYQKKSYYLLVILGLITGYALLKLFS